MQQINNSTTQATATLGENEQRQQIFQRVFDDEDLVIELGAALKDLPDPAAAARANAVLAQANEGVNPGFDAFKLQGLREIWHFGTYADLAPAKDGVSRTDAMWFWRELVSREPQWVDAFRRAIGAWSREPSPERFKEVARFFEDMDLEKQWTPAHAEALASIQVDDIKFKSLKWFGYPGDIW